MIDYEVRLNKAVEEAIYNFLYGDEEGRQPARQFKAHFIYALRPLIEEIITDCELSINLVVKQREDFRRQLELKTKVGL